MNCPQCQAENAPDSAYCRACGTRLAPAAATSPQPDAVFTAGQYPPPSNQYPPPSNQYPPPSGQYPPPGSVNYPPPASTAPPASSVPPANLDLNRLNTVDKVVAGATLLTMISIWLPWFTGSATALGVSYSASVSGTGYHGWLWLEFIVALVLLAYLAARALWETLPFSLPVAHEPVLIAGTGLQFLLILIAFLASPSSADGVSVSYSFGAFLGLIFAVVAAGPVIVPAVRAYLERRKAAGGGSQSY